MNNLDLFISKIGLEEEATQSAKSDAEVELEWWRDAMTDQCVCHGLVCLWLTSVSVMDHYVCDRPVCLSWISMSVTDQCVCHGLLCLWQTSVSVMDQYVCDRPVYLSWTSMSVTDQLVCHGSMGLWRVCHQPECRWTNQGVSHVLWPLCQWLIKDSLTDLCISHWIVYLTDDFEMNNLDLFIQKIGFFKMNNLD